MSELGDNDGFEKTAELIRIWKETYTPAPEPVIRVELIDPNLGATVSLTEWTRVVSHKINELVEEVNKER